MQKSLLDVDEMCVGSVCTQPTYKDKNPPAPFLMAMNH